MSTHRMCVCFVMVMKLSGIFPQWFLPVQSIGSAQTFHWETDSDFHTLSTGKSVTPLNHEGRCMNGQEGDAKTLPTIEESSSLIKLLEFGMYTRTQTWNEIHRDVLSSLQSYIAALLLTKQILVHQKVQYFNILGHARACAFMQRIQIHWPVSWYWDNIVSWKPQLLDLSHTQTPTLTLTLALHVAYTSCWTVSTSFLPSNCNCAHWHTSSIPSSASTSNLSGSGFRT